MDSEQLQHKISELENHLGIIHKEIDETKQAIKEIEDEAAKMKKSAAEGVASAVKTKIDPSRRADVDKLKRDYKGLQDKKMNESQKLQQHIDNLEKHRSEVDTITSELKKHQPILSDLEQKTSSWTSKADQAVNNKPQIGM